MIEKLNGYEKGGQNGENSEGNDMKRVGIASIGAQRTALMAIQVAYV